MRWTEAVYTDRISRDVRFATLYPAQTLASRLSARLSWSLSGYERMRYLQWPDEFDNPTPMVTFGHDFITLLESQAESGATITAEEHWSSFTFTRRCRMVNFTRRGRLGYQRPECWEVSLADRNEPVQLGSIFGIRDYACVVTAGVENIQTITKMWLNGTDVASIIDAVPLWDKMNTLD